MSHPQDSVQLKRTQRARGMRWGGTIVCIIGFWISLIQHEAVFLIDQPLLSVTGKLGISGRGANGGTNLEIRDEKNRLIASCNSNYCGYLGYERDIGNTVVFWRQGNEVFRIEVDSIVRVDEETISRRRKGMKMMPAVLETGGVILVALSFFI